MADFGKGVVILSCPNAPDDDKLLSLAERIVHRYHFLCPSDFTGLRVRKVEDGAIHLRPCSMCGIHWYAPKFKDLPKWARPVPG